MNVLIYAGLYPKCGAGNVLRSGELYNVIKVMPEIKLVALSGNDLPPIRRLLSDNSTAVNFADSPVGQYDVIIYDSPSSDTELLTQLKQYTNYVVALDFFDYCSNNVDVVINLYDQNPLQRELFKGKVYEGVRYAIIRDEILKLNTSSMQSTGMPRILITFGGEDPSSNTIKALNKICGVNAQITVLLGKLNRDSQKIMNMFSHHKTMEFIHFDPHIGKRFTHNDIIICGGGTTLLESIFVGNPIITVGQNPAENRFISHIRSHISLFSLEDMPFLLNSYNNKEFRYRIKTQYSTLVDGLGKQRISEIIRRQI